MKNLLLILFFIVGMLLSGCSKKSEYYIDPPNFADFNLTSVNELSDSDIKLIKEFMPKVIEWYNSVDISKPQSINFISDEINAKGNALSESDAWDAYLSNFAIGEENSEEDVIKFNQIRPANFVYGEISSIMMTNNITSSLYTSTEEKTDMVITIDEDSWIELGDKIRESIEYYYNN